MDKENESQDYVMAPENATEDTFVVMEKLLAFFRYTELRMRSRMLIFLAIAVGSIIACCVSVWSVRSLYETGHISQGISIALTGILVMDGVVVAGGSLARHAKINDKYETMRQIIETDGIPITKQMENDYQANRPSLINMGPYKLRINWHEDYYKKCGFNPEF